MAITQISDVMVTPVWLKIINEKSERLNAFLSSGIAVQDEELAMKFATGGDIATLTRYASLTDVEPRYDNDTYAATDALTHQNITDQSMLIRMAWRNQSWSAATLARAMATEDPVGAITDEIAKYWANERENRVIASLNGILADNVANHSSDMIVDVSADTSTITADNGIDGDAVIDVLQTLGDHKDDISVIAVHSRIHADLQKEKLIDYVPVADTNITLPYYLGKRLVVDDSLPAVAGSNQTIYTCVLFGPGALITAPGVSKAKPLALETREFGGNGGGEEIIWSRVTDTWHPKGFSFLSSSMTGGKSPNLADLANVANWARVARRKDIPLAFLKVNAKPTA